MKTMADEIISLLNIFEAKESGDTEGTSSGLEGKCMGLVDSITKEVEATLSEKSDEIKGGDPKGTIIALLRDSLKAAVKEPKKKEQKEKGTEEGTEKEESFSSMTEANSDPSSALQEIVASLKQSVSGKVKEVSSESDSASKDIGLDALAYGIVVSALGDINAGMSGSSDTEEASETFVDSPSRRIFDLLTEAEDDTASIPWDKGDRAVRAELDKRFGDDTKKAMGFLNRISGKLKDEKKIKTLEKVKASYQEASSDEPEKPATKSEPEGEIDKKALSNETLGFAKKHPIITKTLKAAALTAAVVASAVAVGHVPASTGHLAVDHAIGNVKLAASYGKVLVDHHASKLGFTTNAAGAEDLGRVGAYEVGKKFGSPEGHHAFEKGLNAAKNVKSLLKKG